jgi:REP element-mobilizing transposase RayT
MPRPYRLQEKGLLYHITSRGDDRKKIFISATDFEKFLFYVSSAKEKLDFYLYAYCLMNNHYHLLLETNQPNLSKIMQYINTSYTVYYNVKRKRCGHVFQGRFKSIIVDKDAYLKELTRYIHLNPVRAKMVKSPADYRWSSVHEYIKPAENGIIDLDQLKPYMNIESTQYKEFLRQGIDKKGSPLVSSHSAGILGREGFVDKMLTAIKEQAINKDISHKKTIYGVDPERIIENVCRYYKQNPSILFSSRKKPLLSKKIAVYLLKRFSALTNREIGEKFSISYSAVSKIFNDVETLIKEDGEIKKDVGKTISHLKV